jgi:hypothetical protein
MQVYTQIPSALIFNHPLDGSLGRSSYSMLCAHAFAPGVDVLVVPKLMVTLNLVCPDFVVYDSPVLPLPIAINRVDAQFDMHATQITRIIQRCSDLTARCISVPTPHP